MVPDLFFFRLSQFPLSWQIRSLAWIFVATSLDAAEYRFPMQRCKDIDTLPEFCHTTQDINKMIVSVSNDGYLTTAPQSWGGLYSPFGVIGIAIGGVLRGDTIVAGSGYYGSPHYFAPDFAPHGKLQLRSISSIPGVETMDAVSEQDVVGVYNDTFVTSIYDPLNRRRTLTLHVGVKQETYGWSFGYAENFILLRLKFTNIGVSRLQDVFAGVTSGAHAGGYIKSVEGGNSCEFQLTSNMVWGASLTGNPHEGQWVEKTYFLPDGTPVLQSTLDASGLMFLDRPTFQERICFNWTADFGVYPSILYRPQLKTNIRDYGGNRADYLRSDAESYFELSNGEIDYDVANLATIPQWSPVWTAPVPELRPLIDALDWSGTFFNYSKGPYQLDPGESFEVAMAIIGGESLHVDPNNWQNLPHDPATYRKNLDFSELEKNALWAQWVYDNPGVDTDGDGYRGDYHICVLDSVFIGGEWTVAKAETTYYRGDGVPDWKGAQPPIAPRVWVEPELNGVRVRWNGSRCETEKDPFLQEVDFEGYRVYFGRDNRESSMELIGQYDRQNFDKHTFIPIPDDSGLWSTSWEVQNIPFTLEELRCLYGTSCNDSTFEPEQYTITNTFRHPNFPDSIFYFTKHDYNSYQLGVDTEIRKVYPVIRDPNLVHPDSLTSDDYTSDSLLKFYEYELTIPNLLPSVDYFVSVTAYDFGSPPSGLEALESSKMADIKQVYPYINPGDEDESSRKVYVYPNPYRIDGNYRASGLESRGRDDDYVERVRQVHFNNLPHKCTIRLFTLDGDLIREIVHDKLPDDPTAHHDTFSLINRNGMLIVSGLYYWTVESPGMKVQIGKLAVIM